jgi:hypothetical protein
VKFINTDGMAFIGPGSEWFWTGVSGIVLAVTFIAIYRQLRLQRSQSAIEQLDGFEREWASERMTRFQLDILLALREGADPARVPYASAHAVGTFWEKVAYLIRRGHIDRKLLWNVSGSNCQIWWTTLAPWARERRAETDDPTIAEHFEWLFEAMTELDRRAGVAPQDEAQLASRLGRRITVSQGQLRVEQELRTVILASPDTVSVAQPLATSAVAQVAAPG